jgi:hypothetical protein
MIAAKKLDGSSSCLSDSLNRVENKNNLEKCELNDLFAVPEMWHLGLKI